MGASNKLLNIALGSCKQHFLMASAISACLNLLYLGPTIYMLQVYDRVVPTRSSMTLAGLTLALVVSLGTLAILDMLRSRLFMRASIRLNRRLAGVLLNASFSSRKNTDVLTRQVVREFDVVRQTLTGPAMLAAFDLPWIPIYLLVCYLMHPALGLLVTAGGVVLCLLTILNEWATKSALNEANTAANRAYVSQDQTVASADVIRALGMRRVMVNRHLVEREASVVFQARAVFANVGYVALSRFVRLLLQSLTLGAGAWLAINDHISAGTIFAVSFLATRALGPLDQILASWKGVGQARSAWRNIEAFMDESRAAAAPLTHLPAIDGALEVERLLVRSPGGERMIIQGMSFEVPRGEILAIVGPSGAGKSTLLKALAGAVDYDGAVRFDGAEMREFDPERLGVWLGYAPQEVALFAGTIKENISRFSSDAAAADPELIDEAVIAAAKACGAHDMIVRLPAGYDTVLGWNGRGLSTGQSQRVGLARALFGAPKVVILDEPDAHLDADGEQTLALALKALKVSGRTVVVASHRLGVLSVADRMMVVRDGRIELLGPTQDVVARLNGSPARPVPVPARSA